MLLLDTHIWWWCLSEPDRLTDAALRAIKSVKPNQRAISSISIWEFAMMASREKIELRISAGEWLDFAINKSGIRVIDINADIALDACDLPGDFHQDPADRMIVATARVDRLKLVTKDKKILSYPHVDSIG